MGKVSMNEEFDSGLAPMAAESGGFVDLHRHLDGSLRNSTVVELADDLGLAVPDQLCFHPGMGLGEALSKFAFTLSLLQTPGAVRRIAGEMCEDAEAAKVTTLEIRFAPKLHEGGTCRAIVEAAIAGLQDARGSKRYTGRAGLILCGLYGESPEILESYVEIAKSCDDVVGIDLAGAPAPEHRWSQDDYRAAYTEANRLEIGTTIHVGEGRPPDEIRSAIENLEVKRIGHGTTLLEDPALPSIIRERDVCVEACLTSNWHVGAVERREDHPLRRWLDQELAVCICTDNTLLSQTRLRDEYRVAVEECGIGKPGLMKCIAAGHAASFIR